MTNELAIRILTGDVLGTSEQTQEAVKIAVEALLRPLAQPEPHWIPCSERLPKKAGNYLVTDHNGDIARYIYLDTESSKDYWMRCAKAWMPLPTPWEGGQDE